MPLRWPELIAILAVVVVIFAAGKIPEMSGGLRQTLDNLRGTRRGHQGEPELPADEPGELDERVADPEIN